MNKILMGIIASVSGLALSMPLSGFAQNASSFSPAQQQDIQKIVHDYLVKNPEVLVEASQALQEKEMAKVKSAALQGIAQNKDKLFNNPHSPTAGNPNGNVILVEFFDYQCGHCVEMQPVIEKLLSTHSNVKMIYKQFPIFGGMSDYAAKAALASVKQGKYLEFHNALFRMGGKLDENKILQAAQSVGLNIDQLKKDMNDPAIKQQIAENYQLAKDLRLVGTPSFVLSNKALTQFDFIPGAAPEDLFLQAVDNIAKKQ